MRSIFPERWKVSEIEAALQLGRRALGAERDLEPARDEPQLRLGLGANERLEVAPEPLVELAALEVGQLEPRLRPAGDRLGQALAQELERLVQPARPARARRRAAWAVRRRT